ncbi:hypothetical protein [Nonomuraea sp. NPDC050786]|uniref:hypothetical protein n=1 Tax=Nonomuraea sp. NPDC050786 TaxID=3154840 RepID=UPI0033C65977
MKRRQWGCLAAIILPLALASGLVMAPIWRDNARLETLYQRVLNHPLPARTRDYFPMDRDVTFGKNLVKGSGRYCDYRIRLTLQTALTEEEIRTYYSNATIMGAENKAMISLYFNDSDDAGGRRVIVEVYDSHGWNWDWRCM